MGKTLMGGSTSTTTNTPIIGGGAQNQFFQSLFNAGTSQQPGGGFQLQGAPAYQGPLLADQNANLLAAQQNWAPINAATDYMGNQLSQYGLMSSPFAQSMSNMQQFGVQGGYPGDLMHTMAQYGGVGAPAQSMSDLMQYGGLGVGGQGLGQMAQQGVAGQWGNPLLGTATGGQGSANAVLSPYTNPAMMGGLQGIVAGQGNPINQLPAWQSMVGAQQRNIAEGANQLAEQFNASDNRFSSAYGTAATDYQNQAIANQNALLGQMTAQAEDAAQGRLLGASQTLGQMGLGATGQASGQQYGAGNMLAQLGAGAVGQQSSNAIGAVNNLFGGANQAAMGMYNAQNQLLPAFMNYQQGQQQLGQSGAYNLNNMLMQNLGMGMQLGQQQFNNQQLGINNQYQNWYQSQPQNNPLLQYMYGAATGYTGNTQSSSSPGLLGALGALGGAAIGKFSDIRLKEDITKIGEAGGLNLYTYRYKGLPGKQMGFMAQEVNELYPEAVIKGDDYEPWMIKPGVLLESLARSAN